MYDFLEFVAQNKFYFMDSEEFQKACNQVLENEKSAYRFLKTEIVEITGEQELKTIEAAVDKSVRFGGVQTHLITALKHLSDRQNPDFRNSIKESVSAVESLCKEVSGMPNATLGAVLNVLEKNGKIHPALKSSFSALYGYTSDSDGIRHAMLNESELTMVDAQYMLSACSAFINYVVGKLVEVEG